MTPEEFLRTIAKVEELLAERPALTEPEREAGWKEDWSGIRYNAITGEIDDSLFHHRPTRPTTPPKEAGGQDGQA